MGTDGPDRGGLAPQRLPVKAGSNGHGAPGSNGHSKRPPEAASVATISAPADLDAERDTLASVLLEPKRLDFVAAALTADNFHADRHRLIYEAMLRLDKAEVPIDVPLLLGDLRDNKDPDGVGARTVIELLSRPVNPANVEHYARRVRVAFARRTLYEASQEALVSSSQSTEDVAALLATTETRFQTVFRQDIGVKKPPSMAERIADFTQRVFENKKKQALIPSNLKCLNDKLDGGFARGWVCVVLAPPKRGKTAFVMNNLAAPAMEHGLGAVLYFGEMSEEEHWERFYACYTHVPVRAQKKGDLTDAQKARWHSEGSVRFEPWRWEAHPPMPIDQVRAVSKTYMEKNGPIAMIVIDYVQLVHNGIENRTADIEYTTRGCKLLAAECDCLVVPISQPTVNAARDKDGTGVGLHDGRGAGSIAADCDICLVPMVGEDGKKAGLKSPGARHVKAFDIPMEGLGGDGGELEFCGERFIFTEGKGSSSGPPDEPPWTPQPIRAPTVAKAPRLGSLSNYQEPAERDDRT